jgi:hypothetical protein
MDNMGKLVVLFSVLGIALLSAISIVVEVPTVPLDELMRYEGTMVRTRGTLTDLSCTTTGNVLLKLAANHTELVVFLQPPGTTETLWNLSYGDELEVDGQVQLYRGAYELISTQTAIRRVKQGPYPLLFVAQVATQPERYEGEKLRITGYLDDLYSTLFYIRDESGTYRLRVKLLTAEPALAGLQEGDRVIAEGRFSYDALNMRYELQLLRLELLPP